jgi:hypothetical protein
MKVAACLGVCGLRLAGGLGVVDGAVDLVFDPHEQGLGRAQAIVVHAEVEEGPHDKPNQTHS